MIDLYIRNPQKFLLHTVGLVYFCNSLCLKKSERNYKWEKLFFFNAYEKATWNLLRLPTQQFYNLCVWGKHLKAIYFLGDFLSIGAGEMQEGIFAGKMIDFKLTVRQ